jgi:hypothetical protein
LCYINIHVDLLCDVAFLPNSLVPSLKTSEVEAPTSNGEEILNIKEFEIEWCLCIKNSGNRFILKNIFRVKNN